MGDTMVRFNTTVAMSSVKMGIGEASWCKCQILLNMVACEVNVISTIRKIYLIDERKL